MQRKVAIFITAFLVLTLGSACALWYVTQPVQSFTFSQAQQIENGMTRAEVEAIIGLPPGNYCSRLGLVECTIFIAPGGRVGVYTAHWASNEAKLSVVFDEKSGRALSVQYQRLNDPRGDELRYWLGF